MRIFTWLGCLFLLSGCALTEDRIRLSYQTDPAVTRVSGAEGVTTVVTVRDARADPTRVGAKKNGFGMEMAAIRADEDVAVTVQSAVESELRARGFRVAPEAAITISVEVTRLWNDFKMGMFSGDSVSELAISAQVAARSGSILYTKNFSAQGTEPNIQLASGTNAKLALDRALEAGIRQLFADPKFLEALLHAPAA
jgi:uncharacterized lipoprotein YajG